MLGGGWGISNVFAMGPGRTQKADPMEDSGSSIIFTIGVLKSRIESPFFVEGSGLWALVWALTFFTKGSEVWARVWYVV